MTRLSGLVVLLCNDVARAAGLPGSSTDSRGSHETPYPSGADAFELPMDGAAGSPGSYAGLPGDTETNANTPGTSTSTGRLDFLAKSPEMSEVPLHAGGNPPALWAGTGDSYMHKMYAAAGRADSPPGSPTTPRSRRAPRFVPQLPHLHDAPQTDVKWVTDLETVARERTEGKRGYPNFLVLRPAFTGGETHVLPTSVKETVQELRGMLAWFYPLSCFGDPSIHVDFRRVANDAASEANASGDVDPSGVSADFLSGDDRVVRGGPYHPTVLQYSKTPAAPPDELAKHYIAGEDAAFRSLREHERGRRHLGEPTLVLRVLRVGAPFTGGETRLLAIPEETVQQLRDRLEDLYPTSCFGDPNTRVNFRRLANDAASAVARGDMDSSGFLRWLSPDERVVWGSADRTTVLQYVEHSKTPDRMPTGPAAPPDEEPHAQQPAPPVAAGEGDDLARALAAEEQETEEKAEQVAEICDVSREAAALALEQAGGVVEVAVAQLVEG